jgi:hypothetical protein
MAGPRFLSIGLMMRFLLSRRARRVFTCSGLRLQGLVFWFLAMKTRCFSFSFFSKSVILSSIRIGAGGGFQL